MMRQLSLLLGSTVLAATLSLAASAQECSNGGIGPQYSSDGTGPQYSSGCCGRHARGPAVLTPVEAYGVSPGGGCCPHGTITPYYAPLSPTPTCKRWHTTCYTPYYIGYCPHRLFGPKPPPYGSDGWGPGPGPNCSENAKFDNYGPYTSVLQDDTIYWRMGGNGLVPYGAPRPPHSGPPDLVDMILQNRAGGGACRPSPGGTAMAPPSVAAGPAIQSPAETTPPRQ